LNEGFAWGAILLALGDFRSARRGNKNMKPFTNGLLTGLVIQAAIGPVFFFVMTLALQRSFYDGLAAVVAVTLVDYFYISLAILGIGKLLERGNIKKAFGAVSSVVLILFGLVMIKGATGGGPPAHSGIQPANLLASFTATFLLAISNPMIVVWNASLLTAKAIEYNYTKRELLIFGFSVGLAALLFMGASVMLFSLIKKTVPLVFISTLNITVGGLLISYGAIRFIRVLRNGASLRHA
jgi:threonine/homoserine/homoserine lactone efflux protein